MSKLLFITQKVDKDDDVLGVYHRWIEELSKKVDKINVICLYKGRVELPHNVGIFSLRKEHGSGRWSRTILFYKYIWSLRKNYNVVFVHMNPIYVLLGGFFWKLSGKKLFLWYNHPLGNLAARVGVFFSNKVFCTSPHSFSARFGKTQLMPAGTDTDLFRKIPSAIKKTKRILYLGRLSPIKNIDCLVDAAKLLNQKRVDFELAIVGSANSESDKKYERQLKEKSKDLIAAGRVIFSPSVPNYKTPETYNSAGIFVNLTPTGSLDKTTLEAMACEVIVLVSNRVFSDLFNKKTVGKCMFVEGNSLDLAAKIEGLLLWPATQKMELGRQFRDIVVGRHSLVGLINQLAGLMDV